jgi:AraC-like DNA-binding protein
VARDGDDEPVTGERAARGDESAATAGESGLDRIEFRTDGFAASDRFEAWRSNVADLFDTAPRGGDFAARFRSHRLDGLMLIESAFSGQRFRRDPAVIARSGLDHYFIQIYRRGGYRGRVGARDVVMRPGDIELLDLAQALDTQADDSASTALVVPRAALDARLGDGAALHGLILHSAQSGLAALLGDHIRSLACRAASLRAAEAPAIAAGTFDLLAACLRPSAETLALAAASLAEARLRAIRQHIETRIALSAGGGATLTTERLCADFGMSRAALYRLFGPFGGIARYVQDRRLAHAFRLLAAAAQMHRRVADIAFDCGFASEAHFSRAFRRAFGVSPRDVRPQRRVRAATRRARRGGARDDGYDSEHSQWLREMRGGLRDGQDDAAG